MEQPLMCPECGREHAEPADARLGHRVPCLDCAAPDDAGVRNAAEDGSERLAA